jgi:protein-tyrosine phosphatase
MHRLPVYLLISLAGVFTLPAIATAPAATALKQKQILFVCTGNFYRSRFAEALFNQKARAVKLNWHANSRGLNLVPSQLGISPFAEEELIRRGVPKRLWSGTPKKLTKTDVAQSDCIILMDEAEHRRPFEKQFPHQTASKIQYWHIPDSGRMDPAEACAEMAAQIDQLFRSFTREQN